MNFYYECADCNYRFYVFPCTKCPNCNSENIEENRDYEDEEQ